MNAGPPVLLTDGTRKYVWGASGLAYAVTGSGANETLEVYHADGLGLVRALTDSSGSVVQTYGTDAFGIPDASLTQGTSTQPFGYTGEQRDSTGLVYLRARMYDPNIGRFMQRDPFAGLLVSPLSLNRFSYVMNNPVRLVDPSGFSPFEAKGVRCGDWSSVGGALCPESRIQTTFGPSLHLPNPLKDLFAALAGADSRAAAEPEGFAVDPGRGRLDTYHTGGRGFDAALETARRAAGDLGPGSQKLYDPATGTLIGERSADTLRGWRIDHNHVNWWDWSAGKKGRGGSYGHAWFPPEQGGPHAPPPGQVEPPLPWVT